MPSSTAQLFPRSIPGKYETTSTALVSHICTAPKSVRQAVSGTRDARNRQSHVQPVFSSGEPVQRDVYVVLGSQLPSPIFFHSIDSAVLSSLQIVFA